MVTGDLGSGNWGLVVLAACGLTVTILDIRAFNRLPRARAANTALAATGPLDPPASHATPVTGPLTAMGTFMVVNVPAGLGLGLFDGMLDGRVTFQRVVVTGPAA